MTEAEQRKKTVRSVTWEEPAEPEMRYDWAAIAEEVKSKPREWAKIFDNDKTSIVNAIRQGAIRPLSPDLGFEVRTRNNVRFPERKCTLFMRYVPGKSFPVTAAKKAAPKKSKGGDD